MGLRYPWAREPRPPRSSGGDSHHDEPSPARPLPPWPSSRALPDGDGLVAGAPRRPRSRPSVLRPFAAPPGRPVPVVVRFAVADPLAPYTLRVIARAPHDDRHDRHHHHDRTIITTGTTAPRRGHQRRDPAQRHDHLRPGSLQARPPRAQPTRRAGRGQRALGRAARKAGRASHGRDGGNRRRGSRARDRRVRGTRPPSSWSIRTPPPVSISRPSASRWTARTSRPAAPSAPRWRRARPPPRRPAPTRRPPRSATGPGTPRPPRWPSRSAGTPARSSRTWWRPPRSRSVARRSSSFDYAAPAAR